MTIDLNADLGEGYPNDRELLDRVSSASISCGAHAGDIQSVESTLRWALERGVAVGAHPGYADREGFGRREQILASDEVRDLILDQVDWLSRLADPIRAAIRFLKPHGALYNQAQREISVARGVVAAAARLGLPLLGQPGSVLQAIARDEGVTFVVEGFPDRRYLPDGRLVPRSRPDAILTSAEDVESQVIQLIERGFDTLCIHGDDPRALANADLVRSILRARRGAGCLAHRE